MSLKKFFCQPADSSKKLFQGVLINNYDCLRIAGRQTMEPASVMVCESPSGEITIRVKVQSVGASVSVAQRVSPGFFLNIDAKRAHIVSIRGLSHTQINVPPPSVAELRISDNRRRALERRNKSFKFATRQEAKEFAHSLLRMKILASIEIHQFRLFTYSPSSKSLSLGHEAQRPEGGRETILLHLLKTDQRHQKLFLTTHIPNAVPEREFRLGTMVYVNRATSLLLDEESNTFSARFEGIRIHNTVGSSAFKRDTTTTTDRHASGGGDVMELTFWSKEDRHTLEAFVKRGKGKSSIASSPFRPVLGQSSAHYKVSGTQHELPTTTTPANPELYNTEAGILSFSSLTSSTLAGARMSRLGPETN